MDTQPQPATTIDKKVWVAEVHLENHGPYIVCRDFNDLRQALDTCFADEGYMLNPADGKETFDQFSALFMLENVAIKFVQMDQKELDALEDFEGF